MEEFFENLDNPIDQNPYDIDIEPNLYTLPTLSDEQQLIIDSVLENKNVIVDAVAGSGKTTLILSLAMQTSKKVLQITYNKDLKLEVREKAKAVGASMEIQSFHSLAVNYYDKKAYTDEPIIDLIKNDKKLLKNTLFDIIVIDETQDMKFLFYQLVKKFISDMKRNITLLIMGDEYQAINMFTGADVKYLTHANKIWCDMPYLNSTIFINLPLSTSYRLTTEVAQFVSHVSNKQINTVKSGPSSQYVYGAITPLDIMNKCVNPEREKRYKAEFFKENKYINKIVYTIITEKILSGDVTPGDIFILAPSIRSKYHFSRELEHLLVKDGIPCYVSGDDSIGGSDVLKDKVVFTTLNQSKGRERKLVFVYNFDSSYFEYYGKDFNPYLCPNIHYVTLTRSTKYLYLCHSTDKLIMPYIKKLDYVDYILGKPEVFGCGKMLIDLIYTSPTDIIKYIKDKYLPKLLPLITYTTIESTTDIKITNIVEFDKTYEEVYDLIGIAIPAAWEYTIKKQCSIVYKNIFDDIAILKHDLLHIIKMANKYHSSQNNVNFKVAQIDNYKWFTQEILDQCIANFNKFVIDIEKFEVNVLIRFKWEREKIYTFEFNGFIDGVINNTVWEFKCVNELQLSHLLQVIVYMFIYEFNNVLLPEDICEFEFDPKRSSDTQKEFIKTIKFNKLRQWVKETDFKIKNTYKLFNCRTGEIITLNINVLDIFTVMDILFENKVFPYKETEEEQFVKMCLDYKPYIEDPLKQYKEMKLDQLKQYCRDNGIKGFSTKNKDELITLVINHVKSIV